MTDETVEQDLYPMAGGNGGFDPIASWAKLSERVENQGKDIVDLRSNMNTGFQTINANLSALSHEIRAGSRTQWPVIWSAIGVSFAIIVAIGGLAYAPINANMSRVEQSLAAIGASTVPREEMDWRQARALEDRTRMEANFNGLRADQVPRAEHERVWQNYDQRFADHQRQIDEMKAAQTSIYSQRDAMLDMRDRIDRLEARRLTTP